MNIDTTSDPATTAAATAVPAPRRQRLSLALRLVLLTLVPALLVLVLGGWWLRHQMHASLYSAMAQTLQEKALRIAARLQIEPPGKVQETPTSGDEFSAIFSGWYWQVRQPQGVVVARSRSLWDQPDLQPQAQPLHDSQALHAAIGPQQEALLMHSFALPLPSVSGTNAAAKEPPSNASANLPNNSTGPTQAAWQLQVFAPASGLQRNVHNIDRILLLTGVSLLALLAGLIAVQVRIGLAPLHRLVQVIAQLRQPAASALPAVQQLQQLQVGPDLEALRQELQALVQQNAQIVARARSHAADLNHALKKPLSVLSAAASHSPQVDAQTVLEHTRAMGRLIDRYQARTHGDATHAALATVGQQVPVKGCVEQLLQLMRQLHSSAELEWLLDWQLPANRTLLWQGDRADLEEMLGNLLDNAGKWAASTTYTTVSVAEDNPHMLCITVEDDGPGLSASQLQAAGARGLRFDESVQGSGLGLSITQQIAHSYHGQLLLDKSPCLKGLRVSLRIAGALL